MKLLAFLLMLCCMVTRIDAEERLPLVHQKGSSLSLTYLSKENETQANFSGRITGAGVIVVKWWPGTEDNADEKPDYDFYPDNSFQAHLPHFSGYVVNKIELLNGDEALKMVAGEKLASSLKQRKIEEIKVKGTFVFDSYEVGVECDSPWAKARLVKIEKKEVPVILTSTESDGC